MIITIIITIFIPFSTSQHHNYYSINQNFNVYILFIHTVLDLQISLKVIKVSAHLFSIYHPSQMEDNPSTIYPLIIIIVIGNFLGEQI